MLPINANARDKANLEPGGEKFAGQLIKKRVFDLYADLKFKVVIQQQRSEQNHKVGNREPEHSHWQFRRFVSLEANGIPEETAP